MVVAPLARVSLVFNFSVSCFASIAKGTKRNSVSKYFFNFPRKDFANLRRGVDFICATPGRLRDHIKRKSISLDSLQFLVLDEADEMLKVGDTA